MKKLLLLFALVVVLGTQVYGQELYTADTVSIMSSTPSSTKQIVDDNGRVLSAQPSRSTTNFLHQGSNSVTITLALNSQSQLAALSEVWVWAGVRLYKTGGTDPLGELDWGGNVNDWGNLTNTALRMTKSGNNYTLTVNNIRQFYNVAADKKIARLSYVARSQAQPENCNISGKRCNQTNNREFSFSPETVTSVRQSDEFISSVKASPNPFAESMHIYYTLKQSGVVSMKIFNSMGTEVKTLLNAEQGIAGPNVIAWYGDDNSGTPVTAGVYFYRIELNNTIQTGQVIVSR